MHPMASRTEIETPDVGRFRDYRPNGLPVEGARSDRQRTAMIATAPSRALRGTIE
jgi:hypothetical protein